MLTCDTLASLAASCSSRVTFMLCDTCSGVWRLLFWSVGQAPFSSSSCTILSKSKNIDREKLNTGNVYCQFWLTFLCQYCKEAPIYFSNLFSLEFGMTLIWPISGDLLRSNFFWGCKHHGAWLCPGSLVLATCQKKFDIGRSPKIGQGSYQTQEKKIWKIKLDLFTVLA